ncbi:MAG: hypothetical protein Q9213_006553, partial [Squamulea squamosa]
MFRSGNPKPPRNNDMGLEVQDPARSGEYVSNRKHTMVPFEQSLFSQSLREHGVGPRRNTEIHDFYRNQYYEDAQISRSNSSPDDIRKILEADTSARETSPGSAVQWRRVGEEPIGTGSCATVWLWEKQISSHRSSPPIRVVVKDAIIDDFWRDNPTEGILLHKLNDLGCKTVVTVYDWMYKPGSPNSEEGPLIRIVEEYAEHGDLAGLLEFYMDNKLIIPEAFLWHVFWSGANTLCYCRHGTTESSETIRGWNPITHMDVKPENLLMTRPDNSVKNLYPSIKMGDFGGAYTVPERGNDIVRAWKSTWSFGTEGFMAPEVDQIIRPEEGSFDPVPRTGLHGSHTDIYSLGKTISCLMYNSMSAVESLDPIDLVADRHIRNYYSTELRDLVKLCHERRINRRPQAYEVYLATLVGMKRHQRIAGKEQADAEDGYPFHSQVLYTKKDQTDFERDSIFRIKYEIVNRAPLKDGKKTEDPGELPPSDSRPDSERTPTPPHSSHRSSSSISEKKTDPNKYDTSSSQEQPNSLKPPVRPPPLEPAHDRQDATNQYNNFMNNYYQQQPIHPSTSATPNNAPRPSPSPDLPDIDDPLDPFFNQRRPHISDRAAQPATAATAAAAAPPPPPRIVGKNPKVFIQIRTPIQAIAQPMVNRQRRPPSETAPRGGKSKKGKAKAQP